MKQTVVFIDLETGGLSPSHADIQIACAAVGDWQVLEQYEAKIQFFADLADPEVLAMNSYDADAWKAHAGLRFARRST